MKPVYMFVCSAVVAISACLLGLRTLDARAEAGQSGHSETEQLLAESNRKLAPNFSLTDAGGKPVRLNDYRGKVVLLDFWATWCGGCKQEIPWYIEFDERYRDAGLAVVGVSMDDEGWAVVKPFLARKRDAETGGNIDMHYTVVIGNEQLGKAYNLTSMPMTLLIDRQGRIALSHTGVVNKDAFEADIRQLLR